MTFKPIFWAIFTCLRPFLREKIKIRQYMYIKTQYSSLFWKILMSSHMSGTLYTCGGSNIKKWRALIESTVKFSRSRFSKSNQKLTDCFHLFSKGYAYFTSGSRDGNWILSDKSVEDPLSVPGRILSPLYDNKKSDGLMYILYNDEHPEGNTRW